MCITFVLMSYTTAIRLPESLTKKVRQWAKAKKKSRSEIIREALADYFERAGLSPQADPYQALTSLMPFTGSGVSDLASQSETYLRQKFHARSRPH